MRNGVVVAALAAAVALAACGVGGTGPGNPPGTAGDAIAERFEELADSLDGEGWPTSEPLRHAAKIVRLAGGATPVTLTIDGESREFLAVAEQMDWPQIVCTWPDTVNGVPPSPGDAECEEVGTWSMRGLIAWEPDEMAEVVRLVADLGQTEAQQGTPDPMNELPTGSGSGSAGGSPPTTPDSAVGTLPGFFGEYLVNEAGVYSSVDGSQSNDLVAETGACEEDDVVLDWARFECRAARFRFQFAMRVQMMRIDPMPSPTPDPSGSHDIAMASTELDGVRLEVTEWTPPAPPPVDPPPGPPPGPPPVDSTEVAPE